MKVVINKCFGGFGLSPMATRRYAELSGFKVFAYQSDYESKDFNKTIRWNESKEPMCIFWIKEDLGDNPDNKALNKAQWLNDREIKRDDSILVQVVTELGDKANGRCAELRIVEIPDGINYDIDEYDGMETIHEVHKSWG